MYGSVIYETSSNGILTGMNMNIGGMGANANMRGKRAGEFNILIVLFPIRRLYENGVDSAPVQVAAAKKP